jgi:hypothetical protein
VKFGDLDYDGKASFIIGRVFEREIEMRLPVADNLF